MNSQVVEAPPPAIASHRGTAVALGLAGVVAIIFFSAAALPYFLSSTYGPPEYAPRRGWLLLHIAGGAVALFTGPLQLWLGLADRGMAWHRRMGKIYMAAVAVGAIGAFYLSIHTDFGWVFGAGLFGLATAWVLTTGLALVAIKRMLIDQHKEWMIRSYVVTFAFVVFRMIFPALQAAKIGTPFEELAVASWACWTIPLLVTEVVLQGRKILAVKPV
jgi:hypothetical protein